MPELECAKSAVLNSDSEQYSQLKLISDTEASQALATIQTVQPQAKAEDLKSQEKKMSQLEAVRSSLQHLLGNAGSSTRKE